ncbi:hypothetical protein GCM10009530_51140 [Microbispora corallina]|uniref:GNAT family N-acetyltransferase n=1 Tax=Microbispora corallina TaxID=83302 RepID=A0ABQ4G6K0_9ACTN|nr:peptidogalycan biosysnthesis protein [Microbispora corallina]GIH42707.1 hypothetical protein Mco01_57070 [Microbispora corallina]
MSDIPLPAFSGVTGGMDAATWDALARDHFYSSADWLRFCAGDRGVTTGGLHLEVPGAGTAGVPVTAVRSIGNPFYQWHRILDEAGLPSPGLSGLLVGAHRGYQTNLLASPGLSREQAAKEVLAALEDLAGGLAAQGLAGADGVPVVAMFLSTPDVVALRAAGVQAMPVALQPDAWIPLPEDGGWDAWLRSLPSSRRAGIVRRDRRVFLDVGYEVVHTTLGECGPRAARLLACTERRYGHDADVGDLTESIRIQSEALGAAARVLLLRRPGEEPVGYCLYYIWGDTLYLRAAGFDYDRLAGAAEYFNLVYYIPLLIACENGVRRLHAGIEAAEAKVLRGAELRPLWMLDLSRDSVLDGRDDDVRAYNAAVVARWSESSPAVAKALVRDLWEPFC